MGHVKQITKPGRVRSIRGESGITLVEAMAGMIVLALGLLALIPMATTAIDSNQMARRTGDAFAALANRIETLRTQAVIAPGSSYDSTTGMSTQWWTDHDPGDEHLKRIIVEVSWYSEGGLEHRQRATTYLYRRDE